MWLTLTDYGSEAGTLTKASDGGEEVSSAVRDGMSLRLELLYVPLADQHHPHRDDTKGLPWTPFHRAAADTNLALVEAVARQLKTPAALWIRTHDKRGVTVLDVAAARGQQGVAIIKSLLRRQQLYLHKSPELRTVLHYAAIGGSVRVFALLKDALMQIVRRNCDLFATAILPTLLNQR